MKRFLDCTASDFENMKKKELLEAISASEGRVLVCETIGILQPMLGDVTNAEFVASMGADMILLNMFDVNHPVIQGLPKTEDREVIRKIKQLTGRPVGINLEPLEQGKESSVETNEMWKLSGGRVATLENAKTAVEMGVDFIVLTGNPGIGVTNAAITDTLKLYREHLGEQVVLIAGKMHASGILSECGEHILTEADVRAFAEAGADIILLPEIPYDLNVISEAIEKRTKAGKHFTIIAVAEGAMSKEEAAMPKKAYKAKLKERKYPSIAYELAEEIQKKTDQEVRITVPGHTQRGGSPCPYDRVLATRLGAAAAELILKEEYGYMVGMKKGETVKVPLSEVAGKLKMVDPDSKIIKEAKLTGISFGDK